MRITIATRGMGIAFLVAVLLSACSAAPGLQTVGLPGSDVSGYTIRARFADALDLVPLASVKLDGVKVGVVEKVDLAPGMTAQATLRIQHDVRLPASTHARVAQTSLLGEKYVQLLAGPSNAEAPAGGDELSPGALIDTDKTSEAVEVEQVLGAASVILNGGGIDNLQEISTQLSDVLDGREGNVRALLEGLSTSLATVNSRRADIARAMANTDRLAAQLASQRAVIDHALTVLPRGVHVLQQQQHDLVNALDALGKFGDVAHQVIRRSSADVVADLKLLEPILAQISKAAPSFFSTLDTLLTYPFARNIYGGMAGDYAQMAGKLDIDLASLAKTLLKPGPSMGDPNPRIQCGQYGSNCRPGPATSRQRQNGVDSTTSSAPNLGADLLDQLGSVSR
jgi:phospholipid/cholesterol/gamma-HCH transport system substrate-binding protein